MQFWYQHSPFRKSFDKLRRFFWGGGLRARTLTRQSNAPPFKSRRHLMLKDLEVIINFGSFIASLRVCYLHLVWKYINCLIFYQAVWSAAVSILSKTNFLIHTVQQRINRKQQFIWNGSHSNNRAGVLDRYLLYTDNSLGMTQASIKVNVSWYIVSKRAVLTCASVRDLSSLSTQ